MDFFLGLGSKKKAVDPEPEEVLEEAVVREESPEKEETKKRGKKGKEKGKGKETKGEADGKKGKSDSAAGSDKGSKPSSKEGGDKKSVKPVSREKKSGDGKQKDLSNEAVKVRGDGGMGGVKASNIAALFASSSSATITAAPTFANGTDSGSSPNNNQNSNNNKPGDLNILTAAQYAALPKMVDFQPHLSLDSINHRPRTRDSVSMREDARVTSTNLLLKEMRLRSDIKSKTLRHDRQFRLENELKRKQSELTWQKKLQTSPFKVNLLAESQRVDEENRIRQQDEYRRNQLLEKRKEKVKNEIILQALSEVSDMDRLREEKRNIFEEERRIKAILDLERTKGGSKGDAILAQQAEKERVEMSKSIKRSKRMDLLKEVAKEGRKLLLEKLTIAEEEVPYGIRVGKGIPQLL